jgi:hypothetical protein
MIQDKTMHGPGITVLVTLYQKTGTPASTAENNITCYHGKQTELLAKFERSYNWDTPNLIIPSVPDYIATHVFNLRSICANGHW